jgi:hypothetical protein
MKRLFCFLALALAFTGNVMAQSYEPKLDESYTFTDYGDNANVEIISQDGINCLRSIGNSGHLACWYSWAFRFAPEGISTSGTWTAYNRGYKNTSGQNKLFNIVDLHDGDLLYIEYDRDNNGVARPTFSSNNVSLQVGGAPQVDSEGNIVLLDGNHGITRNEKYFCVGDGTVSINCASGTYIQKIEITSWKKAKYEITSNNGTYKFEFTEAGVLTDKHAAVPFMTMQFGSDNNLTYVKRFEGNVFGSASKSNGGNTYTEFSGTGGSSVPNEGTYYYFFPEANGKLIVNGYQDSEGINAFVCINESGASLVQLLDGKGDKTFEVDVEKGKHYYIARNVNDQTNKPVFHLLNYTFTPEKTSYVGPLSYVVDNGSGENSSFLVPNTANYGLQSVAVKNNEYTNGFLGNVESATVSVENGTLKVSNVVFKTTNEGKAANKGGAILVRMNPSGTTEDAIFVVTIAYKAEEYANKETNQIKVWDFYSTPLALGNGTVRSSQLYNEIHQTTPDWQFEYLNRYKNTEPVYKSVYDMEGDNADMIVETEGLIFDSPTNTICIYNDNPENPSAFNDRFVGMLVGGKLSIPNLKKDDRVRVLMSRYGGTSDSDAKAVLTIGNGRDVSLDENGSEGRGKLIESPYVIGGASSRISGGKCVLFGDYNFIVDHDGSFSITMSEGQLLKIYRIEIYRNDTHVTNNAVLQSSSVYEVLYTDKSTETKTMTYILHDHGKGERIKVLRIDNLKMYDQNGNAKTVSFTENNPGSATAVSYTPQIGDYGSYRIMLGNKTLDGSYITDHAERTMAVGYRETKTYPYTWDFTDLYSYVNDPIGQERSASNLDEEHKGWESYQDAWCLRIAPNNESGILFANGGQLYGATKMFDETAGLGFKRSTDAFDSFKKQNRTLGVTNTTLKLDNLGYSTSNTEFLKIVVPQVDDDAYIYVRATPVAHATVIAQYSTDGVSSSDFNKVLDVEGDKVYIMKNTAKQDVELWLNGVAIKKIGVSRDSKTVNVKGYASESRDHRIDHSLTKFFTGADVKAYVVQGAEYNNRTLTLFDITSDTAPVLDANQGCVLHYTEDKELKVIDDQFNLFAPDMHDTGNYLHGTYGNMMKANVAGDKISPYDGDYTNYILTYKYYQLDKNGNKTGTQQTGDEMFYRVANGGATAKKNSAYLPLLTEEVKPSEKNPTGSAKFTFIFSDLSDDNTPTAIEGLSENEMQPAENAIWYNLNGQKLNGKPTKGGLYIVNGKKVLVK